ncbi:MAG: SDR family oxidoreductase [Alphaproteobacteria bacterium]
MNKVAIVTGAGSGIGKSSAGALLNAGFCVVFAGRRTEKLVAAIEECGGNESTAVAVQTDVGDPDSVRGLFKKAVAVFGRVDLVFNNAGCGSPAIPLEELSDEQWNNVVATNLTGSFWCVREAFRVMKGQSPQGGRIINNGSISATTPRPLSSPYTATKHAITGLTKAAALDGRNYDIAVCQIDIGNAATEMTQRMTEGVLQPDGSTMVEARKDVTHVADMIVHLALFPLDANVPYVTIMAPKMPILGRG